MLNKVIDEVMFELFRAQKLHPDWCALAADEIERLREERDKLKQALRSLIALAALKEKE